MSKIKTRNGVMIEAILLKETLTGSIWFAQDRIVATDTHDVEIESKLSSFDISNIMEVLNGELVKNTIDFVISRINPDHSLTEVYRCCSTEDAKDKYYEFLCHEPDKEFVIVSERNFGR